ncbi:MAG: AAA family ATPase [Pseudomonadota bacterium]
MAADQNTEAAQTRIVAFLAHPAAHGLPQGEKVGHVQTPISHVFLAGSTAWKLKRAVRLPYADFSMLDRRAQFCRRELAVNAGAGDLYQGVVPVTEGPSGLAIDGYGRVVDWLVKMRRFDRRQELDRLADAGALSRPMIEALALSLARLHRQAPVRMPEGGADTLRVTIERLAAHFAAIAPRPIRAEISRWSAAALAETERHAAIRHQRIRLGHLRRCHGDLHLGNIVMLDGVPVPFDAIEFDERIATVDVLHDLAFALADLILRDRRAEAALLLSTYLGIAGGYSGLALMPLFLSQRAAVRAMVAMAEGETDKAATRLAFARAALDPLPRPRLIAIGGMSGTGKSTLSQALAPLAAPLAGAVVIRSDLARKRLARAAPTDRLGETGYTARMDGLVIRRIMRDARNALLAGHAVILDATFLGPMMREGAEAVARDMGLTLETLWLSAPLDMAVTRVERREGDASDATAEIVARQAPSATPPSSWHRIDATPGTEAVLAAARAHLGL